MKNLVFNDIGIGDIIEHHEGGCFFVTGRNKSTQSFDAERVNNSNESQEIKFSDVKNCWALYK